MKSNAYHHALSQTSLTAAWTRLYSKTKPISRNTVGVDDFSINDFQSNPKGHLARLSHDVRSGTFKFSPLRPYLIPKANGKLRLISVPTVRDRIVQRALVEYLSEKYHTRLANNISFGFIKGRGVRLAAETACNLRVKKPWIYKTDIASFFDSIKRDTLQSAIVKTIRERSIHPILFNALNAEVETTNRSTKSNIAKLGIVTGQGVRQGMPLSPFFSNLLLISFDQKVHSSGATAVRYADDLIFLCESEDECHQMASFCSEEFGKIGLSVPPIALGSKSVIYDPKQPAEFLGLELSVTAKGYDLRVSETQLNRLTQEIGSFGSIKELLSRKITLRTLGQSVSAKRNGYLAAYAVCSNIDNVVKELDIAERRALKNLYGQGLGINLKSIGADARTFLGLT
ncbi:reverse transcriptase domain-containing protein [Undibacterium sp. TJN25]|uniref:reverse transcriptase domain-containing protein n=1 Tax=Undibacterium sp. TJN25 TaxID=3413056 RepID=UPI003BF19B34